MEDEADVEDLAKLALTEGGSLWGCFVFGFDFGFDEAIGGLGSRFGIKIEVVYKTDSMKGGDGDIITIFTRGKTKQKG